MKYFFTLVMLIALGAGCKQKILSGKELDNKLKETIADYLHKTLQPGVKVTVKDVAYYPEQKEKNYICQFHVDMNYGSKDTIGIVGAIISNDFKNVKRTQ
ncbi:MAG: hypothetical protein ACHQF0_00805 [Chitinophagales bacterium]